MKHAHGTPQDHSSRRSFLKQSTAAAMGGAVAAQLSISRSAHAAGGDVLRVGLIGCGGRGTGAAAQALKADKYTRLTALADLFPEQLPRCVNLLKNEPEIAERVDVPPENQFAGIDAYQKVIGSGVDVVLLAAPPHFRPQHIEAAVAAGKHIFAEKPVAVDAPGVRRILASVREAQKKNLSICSGLCWRYDFGARATIEQIKSGNVGEIVSIEANYNASLPGKAWPMPRDPAWSDMEYQIRNWYWFTWLSGDHIVEQAIHSMDKAAWALDDVPPVSCVGLGGLAARFAPDRGSIFDHHSIVYEYPNGVKVYFNCRQQPGTAHDVSCHVMGVKGTATVEKGILQTRGGESIWRYRAEKKRPMHQVEHDELFAALREGKRVDDGLKMAHSTLLAIMGRMATYTGQKITWEQALNSKEDLTPPSYAWGPAPKAEIAVPGATRFT